MLGKKQFIVDDKLSNSPRRKQNASSTCPEVIVEMSAPVCVRIMPHDIPVAPLTVRCFVFVIEAGWQVKQTVIPSHHRAGNNLTECPGVYD